MENNKAKILFLDHTPFIGGAQLSLIQHLAKINKSKFDVLLGCSRLAERLGLTEEYKKINIEYFFIPLNKLKLYNPLVLWRFAASILAIVRLVKSKKVDIIISFTVRTAIVSTIASLITKANIIWLIRDFTFPLFFFRLFSRFTNKIVFNSRAISDYYQNNFLDKNKQEIVYVGRDFYEKVRGISRGDIIKQRTAWGAQDGLIIGYVGRLVSSKGPQVLVEAVNLLVRQGIDNIKCVIIGTGGNQADNNEEALKSKVKELNLEKFIIFIGFKKQIALPMMSLDVLAMTSIEPESFSSTVIDAMMAKVAVIGTDIGGTKEIIINHQTGLLVRPNDAADLATAIKKIMDDKILEAELIDRAYNHVMIFNTAEHITKQLENIYLGVISRNKKLIKLKV